jgi:hypothetical protein
MRSMLALIFGLSGASALIFESLWFRLAGLSLGNSVWSASLVLAAFMAGLALGNGLAARLHRRILRPVRLYAALEFAIGIGGISVMVLLPLLPNVLGPAFGNLTDMPLLLNALRLTIAFGILLLPAIAMGATLPVLPSALTSRSQLWRQHRMAIRLEHTRRDACRFQHGTGPGADLGHHEQRLCCVVVQSDSGAHRLTPFTHT